MNLLKSQVNKLLESSGVDVIFHREYFDFLIKNYPDPFSDDPVSLAISVLEYPDLNDKSTIIKEMCTLKVGADLNEANKRWLIVNNTITNDEIKKLEYYLDRHKVRILTFCEFTLKILSDFSLLTDYGTSQELTYTLKWARNIKIDVDGEEQEVGSLTINKYQNRKEYLTNSPSTITVLCDLDKYNSLREVFKSRKSFSDEEVFINKIDFSTVRDTVKFRKDDTETTLFLHTYEMAWVRPIPPKYLSY